MEKAAERRGRRDHYYGKDSSNTQYKRRPHIFLFRTEDLDNDDVIYAVESTPTYKRTRKTLEDIRTQASGTKKTDEKTESSQEVVQGIINFK